VPCPKIGKQKFKGIKKQKRHKKAKTVLQTEEMPSFWVC
jgi:hypothetical protein